MKIANITINNFKSYKNEIVDKLSKEVNIIVGKNG